MKHSTSMGADNMKQSSMHWGLALAVVALPWAGPAGAQTNPSPSLAAATAATLRITVSEAILTALQRNPSLRVERLNPAIIRTREDAARAAFDPTLSGQIGRARTEVPEAFTNGLARRSEDVKTDSTAAGVGLGVQLPTGTQLQLDGDTLTTHTDGDRTASRAGLTVTQALLNGFGLGPNLATLRQTRLDTRISAYEFRAFAEAVLANVEKTYWSYALALRQVEIVRQSLKLAESQLDETRERIRIGKLSAIEAAAAEAEVSLRREALINAESIGATTRLQLISLLSPEGADMWQRELALQDQAVVPEAPLDSVEDHVRLALKLRPDINQAELSLERGELEIVKTRNGVLPKMDFFVTLGSTGYAHSFVDSVRREEGDGYDTTVGLRLDYPPVNRAARAAHRRALLSRQQADEALTNLCQLAQVDVRSAHIEALRTREQVAATAVTRRLQEAKLQAETEKFRVGKSTSLLVAQTERDLLQSQVNEIRAVSQALQSRVDLYRLDGSLLDRRGITLPSGD